MGKSARGKLKGAEVYQFGANGVARPASDLGSYVFKGTYYPALELLGRTEYLELRTVLLVPIRAERKMHLVLALFATPGEPYRTFELLIAFIREPALFFHAHGICMPVGLRWALFRARACWIPLCCSEERFYRLRGSAFKGLNAYVENFVVIWCARSFPGSFPKLKQDSKPQFRIRFRKELVQPACAIG